ncbi:MAG: SURF1 family protein [Rhabdaerophilum sp.]
MRGRGLIWFLAFTMIGTIVLVALGTWQWQRRADKRAFIAAIETAAKGAPKPFERAQIWDRVTITGRFLPSKIAFVRTSRPAPKPGERDSRGRVPVSGFGVWVVQAFEPRDGARDSTGTILPVLVSRGFLPTLPNGEIPSFETRTGEITLTGFLRPAEKAGLFPPQNQPDKGRYFFRDSEQMALAMQLPGAIHAEAVSYLYAQFLDREAEPGESTPPFGVEVKDFLRAIPNNHLEYAITWWSLAATNLAVTGVFLTSRRRRRDENAVTDAR